MSRLVIAILILFAVLIGLRAANTSLFQRSFANQLNSPSSATRSTGFSTESTAASNNGGSTTNLNPSNPIGADTTSLPPTTQPAVPAGW